MNKKGRYARIIYGVIGVVMLFSMLVALLPTGADSINKITGHVEGNTTTYGSGPSTVAGVIGDNWGYFVVAGLLGLVIFGVRRMLGNK